MPTAAALGIAAFAVDAAGMRTCNVESAPRLRCASVLKPLLFWVGADAGPFTADRAAWAVLARQAVTVSDNDAASELWSRAGEQRLLANLGDRTGVVWQTENSGKHAWRRVLITADELARAYAAFVADVGPIAVKLRAWMREVPAAQTFGARRVACDVLGVPEQSVAVKCGWFALVRAHAVVFVELSGRTLGAAVTSFRPQDPASRAAYAAAQDSDSRVLAVHDEFAGPLLRSGTRRAFEAAIDL